MQEISRGAEAIIYDSQGTIIKERPAKSYRIPELDEELRTQRTRREASLLEKVKIAHPKLISTDRKDQIVMEKIEGEKLRDVLDEDPKLTREVGSMVAQLHNQDVIHGDLTTSNMIKGKQGIVFIDFGLSFHSAKAEDKAVDIHLFKQALNSKHHSIYDQALKEFLKGYASAQGHDETLKRLRQVEARGRYRKG